MDADSTSGEAKAFDLAQADGQGGAKPFRIVVARNGRPNIFSYRNACPHQGVWLNIGSGAFLDESGAHAQMRPARREIRDRER